MKKLKIAVHGLGHSALSFHLPCLSGFNDIELFYCDAWEASRERAFSWLNISRDHMFSNQRTLLEKVRPDAVYVLMPQYDLVGRPPSPYENYVNEVLEAGIPLFVEKPLGVNATQARRIADKANACGVKTTMVGCQRRFNPLLRHGLKLVKANGPILAVNMCFFKGMSPNNDGDKVIVNNNWLTYDMIHALDLACWIPEGKIMRTAVAKSKAPGALNWTGFDAMMTFDSGVTSHFTGNVRCGGRILRFELHGVDISIFMISNSKDDQCSDDNAATFGNDMTAWVYRRDPENPNINRYLSVPEMIRSIDLAPVKTQHGTSGFWAQARHFIDCVRKGCPAETSFDSAMPTIEVCDKIIAEG